MNGGGCGRIIFGIKHKSTEYWTVNVIKFKCKEKQDTEEIVKLSFESIRMLVDYCKELFVEGEHDVERWPTSPRLAKIKENNKRGGNDYE